MKFRLLKKKFFKKFGRVAYVFCNHTTKNKPVMEFTNPHTGSYRLYTLVNDPKEIPKRGEKWLITFTKERKIKAIKPAPQKSISVAHMREIGIQIDKLFQEIEDHKKNTMKKCYLNLWDDFSEDGPAETWIQLEGACSEPDRIEEQKEILNHFFPLIQEKLTAKGVTAFMYLYDTKILYPHMDDVLHSDRGWKHSQKWKIKLQGITHEIRETFMDEMKNESFQYKEYNVSFISES